MFRKIKFLFLALCAILCFSIASACTPLGPDGDSGSNGSQRGNIVGIEIEVYKGTYYNSDYTIEIAPFILSYSLDI